MNTLIKRVGIMAGGVVLFNLGLYLFEKAPGGVNYKSLVSYLVVAGGVVIIGFMQVKKGFNGSLGQIVRLIIGGVSFIAAMAGASMFFFIANGAFDVPQFGKDAAGCLALIVAGCAGIAIVLSKESGNSPRENNGE